MQIELGGRLIGRVSALILAGLSLAACMTTSPRLSSLHEVRLTVWEAGFGGAEITYEILDNLTRDNPNWIVGKTMMSNSRQLRQVAIVGASALATARFLRPAAR